MSDYTPTPGKFAALAIEFFKANPGTSLNKYELAERFGAPANSVHTLLRDAVHYGVLKRQKDDDDGELMYSLAKVATPSAPTASVPAPHVPALSEMGAMHRDGKSKRVSFEPAAEPAPRNATPVKAASPPLHSAYSKVVLRAATAVLQQISFPGYTWHLQGDFDDEGAPTYLQARFNAPCAITGEQLPQSTRKWQLSRHMTRSELVQTALKCVLTSVEHEARERFTYRGHATFGPHFNVERLVELCQEDALEVRS